MLPESVNVMMFVADVFTHLHIPYMVGSSMASALYGVPRSTLDADMIADLNWEKVSAFINALGDDFYADEEMMRDAIRHRSSFNLIHLETMFKIDIFIPRERPYDKVQLSRRVEQTFSTNPERKAFITTAEDILLAKLEWYRQGGEVSDRQWRDILGILKVQAGQLDLDYLNQWASELGVYDLLQKALEEAE